MAAQFALALVLDKLLPVCVVPNGNSETSSKWTDYVDLNTSQRQERGSEGDLSSSIVGTRR